MTDLLELTIDRPVAGGRMLARHEQGVVLVAGAIPGERVRARVQRTARDVTFAEVVEVIEPSPDRRVPHTDPACGGLTYAHIDPARQRLLKADVILDAFRRQARIALDEPVTVAASPAEGYRLRARLHVRNGRLGFFREQTHALCDAGPTRQLLPGAIAAAEALLGALGRDADRVDAITVAENVPATCRVLHLDPVGHARLTVRLDPQLLPGDISGVTTLKGRGVMTLSGLARVTDTAADVFGGNGPIPETTTWARSAASFFQGNRFLLGSLLRTVLRHVQGERTADMYAGVGLFAVALAASGRQVLAVEGDPIGSADLRVNAAPWAGMLEAVRGDVEMVAGALNPGAFDTLIVDPPRSGVSGAALSSLLALIPARLIYVSCDPATMARDAGRITASGYRMTAIEAFDLFPNTPHVETVAVFDR
jgi:23S rRNA (uracil1939-C5)-methyltransferase